MLKSIRWVGGAGTGKTTSLERLIEKMMGEFKDLRQIGFASFSRAARHEIVKRLCSRYGYDEKTIRNECWFRTLHSIAYSQSEIKSENVIAPTTARGKEWLSENLECQLSSIIDETGVSKYLPDCIEAQALNIWDLARNSLQTVAETCDQMATIYSETPHHHDCMMFIERYESAKRVDHKVDFVDILALFTGINFGLDEYRLCTPSGVVPAVTAWLIDEAQDLSPLTAMVVERLVQSNSCKYLYLVGDPFQSIYGFAGSSPKPFMDWNVDEQHVMPRSWRCPAVISQLGEKVLSNCSDYWERNIKPAEHEGVVVYASVEDLTSYVKAGEDWLVLARTNAMATKLRKQLESVGIPTRPTTVAGVSERYLGLKALYELEKGKKIDPTSFKHALKLVPTKGLLKWGTKTQYCPDDHEYIHIDDLLELGCKEQLQTDLFSGKWEGLVDNGAAYRHAADSYGIEEATLPSVRVGTIHSVKGAEADNVFLATGQSERFAMGSEVSERLYDEELRLTYVGITRARKRLIVGSDPRHRFTLPGL